MDTPLSMALLNSLNSASGYFGLNYTAIETFLSVNHMLSAFVYNLLFLGLTSFSFSVSVMVGLGTFLFPWYEVFIYAMIGIMGSAIIHFYISRKLGKSYVKNYLEKHKGKIEKFEEIIEKNTFKSILILSAISFVPPTIPNFLGGVIMGLNSVPFPPGRNLVGGKVAVLWRFNLASS